MKALVFSDSHGDISPLDGLIKRFNPEFVFGLGDYGVSKYELDELNVLGVKGNSYLDPEYPLDFLYDSKLNNLKILFTHGHTHNVRSSLLSLSLFAKDKKADIVFYGHTHVAKIIEDDSLIIVNPGSLGRPYSPTFPTVAIINATKEKIKIDIVDASTYEIYKTLERIR